jgi:hypothetical protein
MFTAVTQTQTRNIFGENKIVAHSSIAQQSKKKKVGNGKSRDLVLHVATIGDLWMSRVQYVGGAVAVNEPLSVFLKCKVASNSNT